MRPCRCASLKTLSNSLSRTITACELESARASTREKKHRHRRRWRGGRRGGDTAHSGKSSSSATRFTSAVV
eukprot:4506563-Pleurochrysis_carterae.AAC.1